jgi:hypothetical protein
MNWAQRIALGLTLLVLVWWGATCAPYTPSQNVLVPPPRHPLFLPGQLPSQELDAGRAAVEALFIVALGVGVTCLVAGRRRKETK